MGKADFNGRRITALCCYKDCRNIATFLVPSYAVIKTVMLPDQQTVQLCETHMVKLVQEGEKFQMIPYIFDHYGKEPALKCQRPYCGRVWMPESFKEGVKNYGKLPLKCPACDSPYWQTGSMTKVTHGNLAKITERVKEDKGRPCNGSNRPVLGTSAPC